MTQKPPWLLVFVSLLSIAIISGCRDNSESSWRGKVDTKAITGKTAEMTPETKVGKDGAEMMLIPAGNFQMGSDDDWREEKPAHRVYLDAFYMDKYEVTNAQYRKFMDATGYEAPKFWEDPKFNAPDHPVVGASWQDAQVYAKWAGKRLPTEAEWEKAARGGLDGKKFPWGDKATHNDANYGGVNDKDKWDYTAPVGSFAPNGYGLYDMAGNTWEWCADFYADGYYSGSPGFSPAGPASGFLRVIRGGAWNSPANSMRVSHRNNLPPSIKYFVVGFRCVAR